MALKLLMNHNVRRGISTGLRLRGVDVVTAFEDGSHELPDALLLDRAEALGRVLFTCDDDLIAESRRRQKDLAPFPGVIYAHQLSMTIGACVEQLELVAKAAEPEELVGQILFLPLR